MFKDRQESSGTFIQADTTATKHASGFARAVAVGVGVNGLGVLDALFGALKHGSDLAFVIVQHGSPSAPDTLTERLAELTDLRVTQLQYGAQLAVDEVRVAPPGYAVELQGGRLQLELLPEPSERRTVVDRLFRSLARSLGARAVGVVLPGTGTDGALGARAIAREGGAVFAAHDTGPASGGAGDTDSADNRAPHVFGPIEIAQLLQQPNALNAYARTLAKNHTPGSAQAARLAAEKLALREQNEALQRENAQLQQRLATAQARDHAWRTAQALQQKLLSDASIGVVGLDGQLRVESISGAVSGVYALTQADIGQPLAARAHHAHNMPPLPALDSLRAGAVQEAEVVTSRGRYLRRIVPRHDAAGRMVVGMSLVFIDITPRPRVESVDRGDTASTSRQTTTAHGTPQTGTRQPSVTSYVDEAPPRTWPTPRAK